MNIHNEVLRHVNINNSSIKNLLNGWNDYILKQADTVEREFKSQVVSGFNTEGPSALDRYQTDEYRMSIVNQGPAHEGYPEDGYYVQIKPEQLHWQGKDYDFQKKYIESYTTFNNSMVVELGIRRNALCVAYPPGGFIGWHNNANASSYNLIFTYSETGDGYWQHINPHTNEVETIPDVPGWQCKAAYFGSYSEHDPKTLIYHTAKTNSCWRLTVSYIFDRTNKDWWEQAIEEIESD